MSKFAIALLIAAFLALWSFIGYSAWLHVKHSGPSDWLYSEETESP